MSGLALELIEGQPHAKLARALMRAKALARPAGPSVVLLEEVIGVAVGLALYRRYEAPPAPDRVLPLSGQAALMTHGTRR